ncbi:MAG: 50S ribosomal protein L24 [Candidatus Helarchaeales archaeon]
MGKTKNPGKNRKRHYLTPAHRLSNKFNVHLHPDLIAKHGVKRLPLQKGDFVIVTKGEFKGIEGKVERINRAKMQVFIEGVKIEKKSGGEFALPVYPSNLIISKLNPNPKGKNRQEIIKRRQREVKEVIEEELS